MLMGVDTIGLGVQGTHDAIHHNQLKVDPSLKVELGGITGLPRFQFSWYNTVVPSVIPWYTLFIMWEAHTGLYQIGNGPYLKQKECGIFRGVHAY